MDTTNAIKKKSPTIVVTDSGLGGLSVLAELEKSIAANSLFDKPRLVFFNAVYEHHIGYNQIKDENQKVHVFNSALQAIKLKFLPDRILIACNTLSVLFNKTPFAATNFSTVIGIVETGVERCYSNFKEDDYSIIIILGTPTTINSHAHKNKLIEKGIDDSRIIEQPCYYLESEIQINPKSEKVYSMITNFIGEAIEKISVDYSKANVLLACTHYEYAIPAFKNVLQTKCEKYELINPNEEMVSNLISPGYEKFNNCEPVVEIHSRVDITQDELETLGEHLKNKSIKTYEAVKHYTWDRNIFNI